MDASLYAETLLRGGKGVSRCYDLALCSPGIFFACYPPYSALTADCASLMRSRSST
jgi:hypothetical protein